MTDSDDPSRVPPTDVPSPTSADAALDDDPPLASPEDVDVLPATAIEPALALDTRPIDLPEPRADEADTLDPARAARLAADRRDLVEDQQQTLTPAAAERLAVERGGTDVIPGRGRTRRPSEVAAATGPWPSVAPPEPDPGLAVAAPPRAPSVAPAAWPPPGELAASARVATGVTSAQAPPPAAPPRAPTGATAAQSPLASSGVPASSSPSASDLAPGGRSLAHRSSTGVESPASPRVGTGAVAAESPLAARGSVPPAALGASPPRASQPAPLGARVTGSVAPQPVEPSRSGTGLTAVAPLPELVRVATGLTASASALVESARPASGVTPASAPPRAAPVLEPFVPPTPSTTAPLSAEPVAPGGAPGSVWRRVSLPADPPEPHGASVLGSASAMTSARGLAGDEHDTLGMGLPLPAGFVEHAAAARAASEQAARAASEQAARAASEQAARAASEQAARAASEQAARAASALRAPELRPEASGPSLRASASSASLPPPPPAPSDKVEAQPPPAPDTLVTSARDPRGRDDHDTIGVARPAPLAAASGRAASTAGQRAIAYAALALCGGLVLGGGCVACLGGGGGLDQLDGEGGPRVAVVELTGAISDGGGVIRELRRYAHQRDIKAIVVRVDSPGGAVAPSQEIFDAMRAASADKPVVVSMGTVAASGGFWVAMAGDWIVASPGSITGSIGVISQMPDLRGLAELLRVDLRTYKSGPYKDAGNPLRPPQPGDDEVHMELISDVYEQFVETIAERRHLEPDAVRRFADGRIFTGRRAHELGLVDQLGGLHDAAKHALVLVEERRARAADEAPEAVEDEPTLVYPRKPSGGLLRLLSEEAGEGAAHGAGRVIGRALERGVEPRIEAR